MIRNPICYRGSGFPYFKTKISLPVQTLIFFKTSYSRPWAWPKAGPVSYGRAAEDAAAAGERAAAAVQAVRIGSGPTSRKLFFFTKKMF